MIRPTQPLAGRRILVTRAQERAGGLIDLLTDLGADTVLVPVMETEVVTEAPDLLDSMSALRRHPGPAYAVFTSATTVRIAAAAGPEELRDQLRGAVVAAVGPATAAALRERGVTPDIVPDAYVAEALAAALCGRGLRGARVWLPAAEGARKVLGRLLEEAGAEVDRLSVYRSIIPARAPFELASALDAGAVDAVAFTSGSTVDHFRRALGGEPFPIGATAACIGPVTAAAARRSGFPVGPVASPSTAAGLAAALVDHYSGTSMVSR